MDHCKCQFRKFVFKFIKKILQANKWTQNKQFLRMFSTSKVFLVLVILHQGLRLIFNFIPMQFYDVIMTSGFLHIFNSSKQKYLKKKHKNRSWGLAAQNFLGFFNFSSFLKSIKIKILKKFEKKWRSYTRNSVYSHIFRFNFQNHFKISYFSNFFEIFAVILFSWIEFFIYLFQIVRLHKKLSISASNDAQKTTTTENSVFKIPEIVNLPFFGVVVLGCIMFAIVACLSIAIGIFPNLCPNYTFLAKVFLFSISKFWIISHFWVVFKFYSFF